MDFPLAEPVATALHQAIDRSDTGYRMGGALPEALAAFAAAQAQPARQAGPVPSVPANWYKDPSGRFEMRYWNGTEWTEHVATAGKQSIDPPKR